MTRIIALMLAGAWLAGFESVEAQETKKVQAPPSATKPQAKPATPPPSAPAAPPITEPSLKEKDAQAAYAFGMNIAQNIANECARLELDPKVVSKALADVLGGGKTAMTQQQAVAVIEQFQEELLNRMLAKQEQNKKESEAYLVKHKAEPDVKTTASGLQYKVLKAGKGAIPKATDTVTAHFTGKLLDGKVFQSTEGEGGEPMTMEVGNFIPGWQEALTLMKVGDRYELTIPPGLAFGEAGTPDGLIPPNSVLVMEVELLDTKPTPAKEPTPAPVP